MIGPSGIVREALLRGMLAFLAPPCDRLRTPLRALLGDARGGGGG